MHKDIVRAVWRAVRKWIPSARLRGPESESVTRLSLPNGAWWDIETRPTVREFMMIEKIMGKGDEQEATFEILAYLTRAWSFRDPVTADGVKDRHIDEMIGAMEIFADDIVPFLDQLPKRLTPKSSSERSAGKRPRSDMSGIS